MVIDVDKIIKVALVAAPYIYCGVLLKELQKEKEKKIKLARIGKYTLDILQENNVQLSEFDMIVLSDLSKEY